MDSREKSGIASIASIASTGSEHGPVSQGMGVSLNAVAPGEGESSSKRRPSAEELRAAETAYREMYTTLLAMGRRAGFDDATQREVAQRVGLTLVERMHEHDPSKGTLRMWVLGIARHALLDRLRAERVERHRFDPRVSVQDVPSPDLTPEETFRAREVLARLGDAVPPASREVVRLAALGCTAAEVAARLGVSRSHVEWRLGEARRALVAAAHALGEDAQRILHVREAVSVGGPEGTVASISAPEQAESRVPPVVPGAVLPLPKRPSFLSGRLPEALGVTVARPLALAAAMALAISGVLGHLGGGEVSTAPAAAAPARASVAVEAATEQPSTRSPVRASMAVPQAVLRRRASERPAFEAPRNSGQTPVNSRRREMVVKRAVLAFRREGVAVPERAPWLEDGL